jgi:hypothetical protein
MGYVQKFDIQGVVASTKRRRTSSTPSIGRSRGNAGDRTFCETIFINYTAEFIHMLYRRYPGL